MSTKRAAEYNTTLHSEPKRSKMKFMKWYCLMVKSGGEESFKKNFDETIRKARLSQKTLSEAKITFFKKRMKNAKKVEYEQALFPGYVFMSTENLDAALVAATKKCQNFYHFLNTNADIVHIQGKDMEYLSNLLKFGETQGISKAYFDQNQRIVITKGPLTGFEGKITKVNRKQGRATVKIDLCNNEIKFDLAFEEITAATK